MVAGANASRKPAAYVAGAIAGRNRMSVHVFASRNCTSKLRVDIVRQECQSQAEGAIAGANRSVGDRDNPKIVCR
jgi:hypothetical protein